MTSALWLREVAEEDLAVFFEHHLDPEARWMAAFTAKDPTNRDAFMAHWLRILADATVRAKTIVFDGQVAGSVMSYEDAHGPEVTYWIGRSFWGQGIATQALAAFLAQVNTVRPIHARAAKDNVASLRVLEKSSFVVIGESQGFANARSEEIEEWLLELREGAF